MAKFTGVVGLIAIVLALTCFRRNAPPFKSAL